MIIFEQRDEDRTVISAEFLTGVMDGSPWIVFNGQNPHRLQLAAARKLARKILEIPTPLGFVEEA